MADYTNAQIDAQMAEMQATIQALNASLIGVSEAGAQLASDSDVAYLVICGEFLHKRERL
jgi:hypothetical protein